MSKLNLLAILKNVITEQGPIGLYEPYTADDPEYFEYLTIDSDSGEVKKLEKPIDQDITYDEDVIYDEDSLLTYAPVPKAEKDAGIINPNLISDIIKALRISGIPAQVSYSKGNHDKFTSSGNISRHWLGNAVDLSVIDGVGNKGGVASNKGLCCPHSEKFMSGGDKIVAALETLGYKFGEGGNTKAYLWRTEDHYNHIHISRMDRPSSKNKKETETKKEEDKKITNSGSKKTITKSSYIIQLGDHSSKKFNIVWGGTPSKTYGASFMKTQGDQYLSDKNIIYSDWENSVSTLKTKLKDELGEGYTIKSVSGFSKGGEKTWNEINSGYDFVGLIDPSTSFARTSLPSNVKMMSNHSNWGAYPKMKEAIKKMEDSGLSERVGDSKNYNHEIIPKLFFAKYYDNY